MNDFIHDIISSSIYDFLKVFGGTLVGLLLAYFKKTHSGLVHMIFARAPFLKKPKIACARAHAV